LAFLAERYFYMVTKEETISPFEAKIEASRCLECFDAPCARACPAHIDIPEFIRRIKSTNYTGAQRS
jgi:glutamate synthase (NADPH/NADH) small chain